MTQFLKGEKMFKTINLILVPPVLLLGLFFTIFLQTEQANAREGEGPWFQVSLGYNGMAMQDINETDFRWHEDSDGFDLDDVTGGMALSFGLGYDMSKSYGYGLFWEHQYGSTSGTDVEMKADVNLRADIFAGRLNYNFITNDQWRFGVAGALGFLVVNGNVNKTTSGASYGKSELTGQTWSLEGMGIVEFSVGEKSLIQLTAGWREANVKSFKNASATVFKPDGQKMSMDYTGFTARVGYKIRFGSLSGQTVPDIQ
ncbi:MAG: outer membrane beta-barrel protein [bacterium]|nr:outer membrane beta-barrel protein [bacterium]